MSKTQSGQHYYQELIDFYKSISLLRLDEISTVIVDRLPSILSIHYFTLFLYDKDKRILNLICHNHPEDWNYFPQLPNQLKTKGAFKIPLFHSRIMETAILSGHYILEQDFSNSSYNRGEANPLYKKDFFVTIPLMIEKEIVGVLNLNDGEQNKFDQANLEFALDLSEFISMSVSNAVLYEQTRILAVTDGLTGISNRESLDKSLLIEFERSTRYGTPLSLVLLDVDNFKDVNDTYGHQKGDDVLIAVASLLKKFCRTNDIAARYGGEEFLMVLPQSNAQGAFKIAERIREEMMKLSFDKKDLGFSVTVSCGVAELNKDCMENVDQLVHMTDKALYKAKNSGRNKTVVGNTENKR